MIVGLDFDGTVVKHEYPKIGEPNPGAIEYIKKWVDAGGKIVLNTMRSGESLQEAVDYLKQNGIELYGVNKNPTQEEWTTSPKVYADVYVDDAAFGCPKIYDEKTGRVYVDWRYVGPGVLMDIQEYIWQIKQTVNQK
jgi:hypothetical protein